jgi:hypothetical protein
MAKGWETIRTDRVAALPKADVVKKAKMASKVIGGVVTKDYEGLKKEGNEAHAVAVAREDSILAAADANKLQSGSLKKEAADIVKRRAAAASKKKGKTKDKVD